MSNAPAPLRTARALAVQLAGLVLLVALAAATLLAAEPALRAGLAERAAAVVQAVRGEGDESWLRVEVSGRDLVARGEAPAAPERSDALARLAALPEARRIVDRTGLVEPVSPFVWIARRRSADRVDLLGHRPAEIRRDVLAGRVAGALPAGVALRDDARAARGAGPGFEEAATYAASLAALLAPGGTATLTDGTLSLVGETPDERADAALRAALATPPGGLRLGQVAVVPPLIQPFTWSLARDATGTLVAGGHVGSDADRRAILATLGTGDAPLRDRQKPGRGLDPAVAPSALAKAALAAAALLREGEVTLQGSRLYVRGDALDAQAVGEIEALVAKGLPPGLAPGAVELTAKPPAVYRTALRRTADAITLTGHVPDAAVREDVAEALRPLLFGERFVDRARLAPGAPPDLARALTAGAGALALLASGEAVAEGRTLRLTGESLYAEAAERLRIDLPRRLPPGWSAQVSLSVPGRVEPLDAAACAARFAREVAPRPLRFAAASAEPTAAFYPVLDALAALVEACPDARIEIAGHRDPPGARPPPERTATVAPPAKPAGKPGTAPKPAAETAGAAPDLGLPARRAAALVDYLLKAGVPAGRIAVEAVADAGTEAMRIGFRP